MKITRRQFLKGAVVTGIGMALPLKFGIRRALPFSQSPLGIKKFVTPLTGLGPTGIPALTPNTTTFRGTDYYEIVARQFSQTIYDQPGLTLTPKFWGYADKTTLNSRYLGGVIVAQTGRPVKIKAYNSLPPAHILPVDPTTSFAEGGGRVDRIAIHLHGGLVQWTSDGGPFAWYSNPSNGGFVHGSSFLNGEGDGAAIYDYPNNQSARLVWYHDHAYGITRLNAYAGIASAYIITDRAEADLISSGILPNPLGGLYTYGIPLIIQDKTFFDPAKDLTYPVTGAQKGDLWYPHIYEGASEADLPSMTYSDYPGACGPTARWAQDPVQPVGFPSVVPEFFADTILVNGAPYPTITLPPGRFRFRVLNGSQARFYNLQMYVKDGTPDGISLVASQTEQDPNGNPLQIPNNAAGPAFIQIGTEGGFLPAPVVFNTGGTANVNSNRPLGFDGTTGNANRYNLLLAPAERADIIVDFRGFSGKKIILYTDAPAPFPGGDIRYDYYPGSPDLTCIGGAPAPVSGQGPDTRILMQFDISNDTPTVDMDFATTITALQKALPIAFSSTQPPEIPPQVDGPPQIKTLNEDFDSYGRLRQLLGTGTQTGEVGGVPTFGLDQLAAPTEVARRGTIQVWKIFNITGDTHPIHFHLVNVQILSRQPFVQQGASLTPIGTPVGPDPNERGWKETVRMNPGEVTTVRMKFDLPGGMPAPDSPRLKASYDIKGAEYVWHCHILEHEEHDMMRPLVVV